jgi:hypothetical protein
MIRFRLCALGCLAPLLLVGALGPADTIEKKDGAVLEGEILERTAETVTIKVSKYGASLTTVIPVDEIRRVVESPEDASADRKPDPPPEAADDEPGKPTGPAYAVLPLEGELGVEVTADLLRQVINIAKLRKVRYLVLSFDLVGGSEESVREILNLLAQVDGVEIIAHVGRASGPAAAVPLAARTLLVEPGASLRFGEPEADDERGREAPAALLQADMANLFRGAAISGGHDPMIGEAMVNAKLEASYDVQEGEKVFRRDLNGRYVLAEKGRRLVLTEQVMKRLGLGETVRNVASAHEAVGLTSWRHQRIGARYAASKYGADARRRQEMKLAAERRAKALAKIQPELDKIEKQLAGVKEEGTLAEKEYETLKQEYKLARETILADYQTRMDVLERHEDETGLDVDDLEDRAKALRDAQLQALDARFEPSVNKLRRRIKELVEQKKQLEARRRDLHRSVGL